MAAASRVVVLHRSLGIGLVTLAAVFLALTYIGVAPFLDRDGMTPTLGYVMAGIGLVLSAVALLFLKPQVPERRTGQSVEEYWSAREVSARALPVWFLLEGAATLSGIGYLLTGEPAAAMVAVGALVAFWQWGPQAFAKE